MEKNPEILTTDQELEYFCHNVRFIRKYVGLSQKQMAEIMGIGVGSLRKIESGVIPPRLGINALCNLCIALHVPPRILFAEWKVGEVYADPICHSEERIDEESIAIRSVSTGDSSLRSE